MDRVIINICTDDLGKSKDFYASLLEVEILYESEWYIQFKPTNSPLEIGLIDRANTIVPNKCSGVADGF